MPYFWGPSEAYVMTSLTEGDKESRYPPMTFAEYEEAYAKAQERGQLMEFSSVASLTAAQLQAARENVY